MNSILTSISWTDILVTIVSLALTWALAQASDWLKSKSEANKVKTQNESVKNYIQIALDTTSQVVDMLNTTVVNDWKKAAADGKLTDEEIDAITAEARTKVLFLSKVHNLMQGLLGILLLYRLGLHPLLRTTQTNLNSLLIS